VISVPRAWPPKRPVGKLIVALVAWAAGIGFFLVGFMTGSSADVYRWVTTGHAKLIVQQWVTVYNIAAEEDGGLSFVSGEPFSDTTHLPSRPVLRGSSTRSTRWFSARIPTPRPEAAASEST
jgi:hypothetical protein